MSGTHRAYTPTRRPYAESARTFALECASFVAIAAAAGSATYLVGLAVIQLARLV